MWQKQQHRFAKDGRKGALESWRLLCLWPEHHQSNYKISLQVINYQIERLEKGGTNIKPNIRKTEKYWNFDNCENEAFIYTNSSVVI